MEQTLKSYVEQSQHETCDYHNSSYSIYFLGILPKLLRTENGKNVMLCTNYNRIQCLSYQTLKCVQKCHFLLETAP